MLSLDLPGLHPPALPSLPRHWEEYEGVTSISSVALRDLTEGRVGFEEEEKEANERGSCTRELQVATCGWREFLFLFLESVRGLATSSVSLKRAANRASNPHGGHLELLKRTSRIGARREAAVVEKHFFDRTQK